MAHSPFADLAQEYDAWFDKYPYVYKAEIKAIQSVLPSSGLGVEVGVGSGRFASVLKVPLGLDQALPMLKMAQERKVPVGCGLAEVLPIKSESLNYVLMVTVLCFSKNPLAVLREIKRVLVPGGQAVIAFIDRKSSLGMEYEKHQSQSDFYRDARFYSVDEVLVLLRQSGFANFVIRQTIAAPMNEIGPNESVMTGWGQGGFVVVSSECTS